MIDYAQSFEQFSNSLKPIDLALYAGIGIVLWVLFKDKLSPVQKLIGEVISNITALTNNKPKEVVKPTLVAPESNDIFFELVASWKQTRDLAVKSGCVEAVRVADEMFPYLSPTICGEDKQ